MGAVQAKPSVLALANRDAPLSMENLQGLTQLASANSTIPLEEQRFTNNRVVNLLRGARSIYTEIGQLARTAKYTFDAISYEWDADSNVAQLMVKGIVDNVIARATRNRRRNKKKQEPIRPLQVRFMTDHSAVYGWMEGQAKSTEIVKTVNQILRLCGPSAASNLRIEARVWRHETLGSNHSKYFIQDIREVIVTGCNIDNLYNWEKPLAKGAPCPAGKKKTRVTSRVSWHDTGIQMQGPIVHILDDAYNSAWKMASSYQKTDPAPHPMTRPHLKDVPKNLGGVPIMLASKDFHRLNMSNIDNPQDVSWLYLMSHAKDHIWIETPNINDSEFQLEILQAINRRVTVNLLTGWRAGDKSQKKTMVGGGTNEDILFRLWSFVQTRMPAGFSRYLNTKWYSHDGVRPVEGYGEGQSHTKFMSVDGKVLMMGSGNQDTQSWKHSRETNVIVWDRATTAAADKLFFLKDWNRGIVERGRIVSIPRWYTFALIRSGFPRVHTIKYNTTTDIAASITSATKAMDDILRCKTEEERAKWDILLVGHSWGGLVSNRLHTQGWNIRGAVYIASPLHGADFINQIEALLPTWLRDLTFRRVYKQLQHKDKELPPPHPYHTISCGHGESKFDGCVYQHEAMLDEANHTHLQKEDHRFVIVRTRVAKLVALLLERMWGLYRMAEKVEVQLQQALLE